MNLSSDLKVAVLRGGPSRDYHSSLKTGEHVLSTLREMSGYKPIDIFISKGGDWHREGLVRAPHHALDGADVVWNALHGQYGEDGQVQKILESLRIPFTGSSSVASALSMNKDMAKQIYQKHSMPTPEFELVVEETVTDDQIINIFRNLLHPVIVKPSNGSGSVGIRSAHTFNELREAIKETFGHSPRVIVEGKVSGDEFSCVVVEGANNEDAYAFPPAYIESRNNFKRLSREESQNMQQMAKMAHQALGLRHYSISDFIITPKRNIYILETNSSPALDNGSLLHRSLSSGNWQYQKFVDHVLGLII